MHAHDDVTWWLCRGQQPLASVICDRRATPEAVKALALAQLDANPGVYTPAGLAPFEQRAHLLRAHVTR